MLEDAEELEGGPAVDSDDCPAVVASVVTLAFSLGLSFFAESFAGFDPVFSPAPNSPYSEFWCLSSSQMKSTRSLKRIDHPRS